MDLPGVGSFRFWTARPADVVAFADAGTADETIEDAYRRMVLPMVLQIRGYQVLHASAVRGSAGVVAMCAVSGTGKSTIAYALSGRGYDPWADDAVAFTDGDPVMAVPLPFEVRLLPASIDYFRRTRSSERRPVPPRLERGGTEEVQPPVPLAALFLLERGTGPEDAVVAPFGSAAAAFPAVLAHGYAFTLGDADRKGHMMRAYANLVRSVRVFRVRFRPDLDAMPRLLDAIEGAVSGRV
jgi:hypothetical protein